MTSTLCRTAFNALLVLAAAMIPAASDAQGRPGEFPNHAVRLVVPFPPGGATDVMARQIAEVLAVKWKQPVIVENKPGGNTVIGTDAVAKSPPDGHTLGIVTASHVTNPLLVSKLPYDTLKDLTGVMLLTRIHMAVYAHPSFPANTPTELIALARSDPGKATYASATTQTYLGMEMLNGLAGTKMQNVPYKGSAQALSDLLGGHVQLLVDPVLQSTLDHVKSGKLKLIGTLGTAPSPLTPAAPVFGTAVPGYEFVSAFGLVARAGIPPELVRRIRDDFAAVIAQPEIAARIREIGQEPIASTPAEYDAYILTEMKKWEPIVKATGAKLD